MKINHVFIAGWLFFAHPALSAFTATTSAGRASARASKGGATVEEIEDLSREANVLSTNPRLDSQQSLHRASESNIPETPTTVSEPLPTPSMAIGAKDIKVDEKKSRKMAKSYQNARTDFAAKEILKVFKQVKKQQKPNLFNESSQSSLISRLNMFYAHIWKKFREWRLRKKIALILRKQPSWLQRWAQNVAIYHGVDFRSEESALDVKTQRELKNAASFIQKHQPELMATYKESDASKLLEKAQIYNTGAVENDSEYIGHFEIGRNNSSNQHQLDSQRSKKSQKMAKSYQKERIKFAAKEILEAFKKVEYTSPPSSFSFLNKLFRIWKKFTIDRRLRKKIEFLLAEQPSWLQIWAQDVAIYHGVDFRSAGLDLSINAAKRLKKAAMFIQKHQPELMATHKEIDGFKYLEKAQILNTGVARE